MNEEMKNHSYYIVPKPLKKYLLKKLGTRHEIYDIHFNTLQEFRAKYFFKIRDEAKLYLLEKGETLEFIETIFPLLYAIDEKKVYHHPKLIKLKNVKIELLEHDFLVSQDGFRSYLKTKDIVVMGYPLLDSYEEKQLRQLGASIIEEEIPISLKEVYHYDSMKSEVTALASLIRRLNEQGTPYHKMFLAGADDGYQYLLKETFHDFDIPFCNNKTSSLFSTVAGRKYLESKNLEAVKDIEIRKLLLKIEDELLYAEGSPYYDELLKEKLMTTSLPLSSSFDAVSLMDEALELPYLIKDDEYLFVIGMNQNKIPKIYKDEDYLSDKAKEEVGLLTAKQRNKRGKRALLMALSTVKYIYLSYKDSSLQEVFSPSSVIGEYNIDIKEALPVDERYSEIYNKKHLGELLDTYYMYNEEKENLQFLRDVYGEDDYLSYHHDFHPFSFSREPLTLSYSHIDDFAKCPFRYYAKHVLHLEPFKESFAQHLGTIYHEVLSKMYDESFNFERAFEQAKEKISFTAKEEFLLKRLKEELKLIIEVNKEMEKTTGLTEAHLEERIEIPLEKDVILKGFLDKVLVRRQRGKTYYAVFDYKTGRISLNLDYLSYGLHMQLPIYVYLLEKSGKYSQPVFAGLFYQTLLSNTKDKEKRKKELRIFGAVAEEEETLAILDENYTSSSWIKGLSITKQGSLSSRICSMSGEEKDKMIDLVDQKIREFTRAILSSQFVIAPKIEKRKNISCPFCPFASLCFHDSKDNVYIDKEEEEV